MRLSLKVSNKRRTEVFRLVSVGSHPRPSFFFMVAVSTMLAAFGLIMDSTAVVIGAMLVAPLMTPIFGVALALLRGDPRLMGASLRAEVVGVLAAVAAATLLGLALPYFEATGEMLSRTNPNLLDLMVAVLAGAAGAYALVDEKISPALPGVAIATAIVPPLANCGLCLSLGAYWGAWGSFLLFFTNFLSILLVAALVFFLSGMARQIELPTKRGVARRFGLAITGFIVVGVLLTGNLGEIVEKRRLRREFTRLLTDAFADYSVVGMDRLVLQKRGDQLHVMAHVLAPTVITPRQIEGIEKGIEELVQSNVTLYVRTTLTQDVSASGGLNQVVMNTLDGFYLSEKPDPTIRDRRIAEQVLHEYLDDRVAMELEGVISLEAGDMTLLVAHVAGIRDLRRDEINLLESTIQAKVPDRLIRLAVWQEKSDLVTSEGYRRTEFTTRRLPTEEEVAVRDAIHKAAAAYFAEKDFALEGFTASPLDNELYVLLEVKGPYVLTQDEVKSLSEDLRATTDIPLKVYVRCIPETVVSESGYTSFEELLSRYGPRFRAAYDEETQDLIDTKR